jgi:hypothetical protein
MLLVLFNFSIVILVQCRLVPFMSLYVSPCVGTKSTGVPTPIASKKLKQLAPQ